MPSGPIKFIKKKFDRFYRDLEDELKRIEEKFFGPSTKKTGILTVHEFDIKAFCILSHAAFEDYFEKVALEMMHTSINRFANLKSKKIHEPLLALVACHDRPMAIDDSDLQNGPEPTFFDNIRQLTDGIRTDFSKKVFGNQGISKRHLRQLMTPVSINIGNDLNLLNSLSQLSKNRGEFAHKSGTKKILSPQDAMNFVSDCLALCKDVRDQAIGKFH